MFDVTFGALFVGAVVVVDVEARDTRVALCSWLALVPWRESKPALVDWHDRRARQLCLRVEQT